MEPKVELITYTQDPDFIAYLAAKTCYSKDVDYTKKPDDQTIKSLINKVRESGHHSVFEHVSFTFSIKNVSRAFLAQVSRHRILTLSVQSQRYVEMDELTPDDMIRGTFYDDENKPDKFDSGERIYNESYQDSLDVYKLLVKLGYRKEEARLVLPEGSPTKMIMTMNARELLHYFSLRCCNRAQKEHREVATQMLKLVKPIAPHIFKNAGAACIQLGYCPENKMSCGKMPTLETIKKAYWHSVKGENKNE